jgi:hypothetical protein
MDLLLLDPRIGLALVTIGVMFVVLGTAGLLFAKRKRRSDGEQDQADV